MKGKVKRRKAIKCELVRASNSNPGYFKYIIKIQETNGDITEHPVYGVDMQDAISRLIWNERTEMVNKVTNKPTVFNTMTILGALLMFIPAYYSVHNDTPYPILGALVVIFSAFGGAMLFKRYLDKGNFNK